MKVLLTVYGDEAEFESFTPEQMRQAMVDWDEYDKAAREATLRSEVKAAFDRYYEWFSAGRTDLIAENAYNAPAFFLVRHERTTRACFGMLA